MRKTLFTLLCFAAMFAAGTGLKAQEITVELTPGWNWISYPNAEAMQVVDALGCFTPVEGDIIQSQFASSKYINGRWRGGVTYLMPGWGYMYYSARTEDAEFVFAQPSSTSVATAMPIGITTTTAVAGGMVILPEGSHVFLRGVCWGSSPTPDIDGNHTSEGTGIGSFSSTLEGLTPNTTYYVRAYAVTDHGLAYGNELSFTTEASGIADNHAYVDLGLPSGLLWATCNVGASTPSDYGDYFAWGETQPKDTYNWSTYQYCNGSYNTLTKYCNNSSYGYNGFTDNLTILLPEDDAATANWGTDWRMPTEEEWEELYQNTTQTSTIQNGVYGCLFTATNGNSLFLPAAGYRNDSGLSGAGDSGIYWSSSLYLEDDWGDGPSPYFAWNFGFYYIVIFGDRCCGQSVRPVHPSTAPTGAIDGKFTINSNGDQVYFSQGNLQYQASTNTWKFADNQYDYVGSTNSNISSTYSGWIDLFGWGTSGYNHGANCYQPWSTSTDDSNYYAYGNSQYNLNSQTGQADWGYNLISNGSSQSNQWRTLTINEWAYIFNTRETTSGIRYAKAKVNDVNGMILLPDNWNILYYTLNDTNSSSASFSSNIITASQWSSLELHGAVFLPAAGRRYETLVSDVGSNGRYWSASRHGSDDAFSVYFFDSYLSPQYSDYRFRGFSVRLVRVAE